MELQSVRKTDRREDYLARQPTYWMKRVYQAMRRHVDAELRPYGITLSQRDALLALRHTGPVSMNQLAEAVGIEQSSASRLILGLKKRGLLELSQLPDDKRVRLISLTPAGHSILKSTPGASGTAGVILHHAFGSRDIDRLISLLKRAATALEEPTSTINVLEET